MLVKAFSFKEEAIPEHDPESAVICQVQSSVTDLEKSGQHHFAQMN